MKPNFRNGGSVRCAAISLVWVLSFVACSSRSDDEATREHCVAGKACAQPVTGTIHVFAASSLKPAFETLAAAFHQRYPKAEVVFNFASSSELATQINSGAPADVFASADAKNMAKVTANAATGGSRVALGLKPTTFARNKLAIAVARGNPHKVRGVADLGSALQVVMCAPTAPCGSATAAMLAKAKVAVTPKSLEPNVRVALSKVELGEADAAIVYASDVATSRLVVGVAIPDAINVVNELQITAMMSNPNRAVGAWLSFVDASRRELVDEFGFTAV